jgi:phospholipid/cholesterol/gamma-HCH transport system substrate-binding protein
METRASYTLVGAFVLLLVAAGVGFVVWLAKIEVDKSFALYDIYFEGSVSGLREGGSVQYHGVPVGTVQSIGIDPGNVEQVLVTIEVGADTPIREDVEATLQIQGITGLSFVQLTGGSNESPMLAALEGQRHPVIKSKPSQFERIFETVPELVSRFTELVERAMILLNDENQEAFAETLANVRDLTGALAAQSDNIGATIEDTRATVGALKATAEDAQLLARDLRESAARLTTAVEGTLAQVTTTAATADTQIGVLGKDARVTLGKINETADAATVLAKELTGLVHENRAPVQAFSETGLYELSQFIAEARALVSVLTQIAAQVERDPTRFLLGGQQQGYEAQ